MTDSIRANIDRMITALDATTDDFASLAIRDAMITDPDSPSAIRALAADYDMRAIDILPILGAILSLSRDELTDFLLSLSLCPLHRIDYAICFDDDNAECAAIRTIHPSHDT